MDKKRKILVIVGSIAVFTTSGVSGYYLYVKQDSAANDSQQLVAKGPLPWNVDMNTGQQEQTTIPTDTTTEPVQAETPVVVPSPSPTPAPAPTPTPAPKTTPAPTPAPNPVAPVYTYKNGTFSAKIGYMVPNGDTNYITAAITINNDVVSGVTNVHQADSNKSWTFIDGFNSQITGVVVGKPIGSLQPSRVGGASLTTAAFDSALVSIRSQAKR